MRGTGPAPSEDASVESAEPEEGGDTTVPSEPDAASDAPTPPADAPDDMTIEGPDADAGDDASDTSDASDASDDASDAGDASDASDDAGDASDDASDAGDAGDDASCEGVVCNGTCLAASDCASCEGAQLLCAPTGTCVSSCSACTEPDGGARPIECFACDPHLANPIGTCQSRDDTKYCLSGSYISSYAEGATGFHCPCDDGDAGACPGDNQVCASSPGGAQRCITCGEVYVYDLNDAGCKNGLRCNASAATCE